MRIIYGLFLLLIATPLLAADVPAQNLSTATPTTAVAPKTLPTAKIISVKPQYAVKLVSDRVCREVPRTVYYQGRGTTGGGAVLGGIAGGVVGSQIGGGRGNTIATIGGAVLGAAAGNQVERSSQRGYARTEYVTVCKIVQVKKSVKTGYQVTYSYNGKQGMTILKKKPKGDTLPLKLIPAT